MLDLEGRKLQRELFHKLKGIAPTTQEEFYIWCERFLGVRLPRRTVSGPDATPVGQFVWDIYARSHPGIIALGARDSLKTLGVSIANVANLLFKPKIDILSTGAVEDQALKAHNYVKDFLDRKWHEVHPCFDLDPDMGERDLAIETHGPGLYADRYEDLLTRTVTMKSGASVTIVPGTIKKVSGPHPQVAVFDEVELTTWPVLQKWWNTASSRTYKLRGGEHVTYEAQRVLCSTRETASGVMDTLLSQADKRGLKPYVWTVLDAMESCTKVHGGCLCLMSGAGQVNKAACPLWEYCQGRAINADGLKKYSDVVELVKGNDPETFEAQLMCMRPGRKGAVFSMFEPRDPWVTPECDYHPDNGPIYVGQDPGYDDPYALIFVQKTREGFLNVFDEMHVRGEETEDIKYRLLTGSWPESDIPSCNFVRDWFTVTQRAEGPEFSNIEMGVIDYHYPGLRLKWANVQPYLVKRSNQTVVLPSMSCRPALKLGVEERNAMVRRRLRMGPGRPLMQINPRCSNLIREMTSGYRYKLDPATGEVVGNAPIDRHNHCCDALGYIVSWLDRVSSVNTDGG